MEYSVHSEQTVENTSYLIGTRGSRIFRSSLHQICLAHQMPHPFRFLSELDRLSQNVLDHFARLLVSPQAVKNAISEAVRTSNHYVLEALALLPLSANGLGPSESGDSPPFHHRSPASRPPCVRTVVKEEEEEEKTFPSRSHLFCWSNTGPDPSRFTPRPILPHLYRANSIPSPLPSPPPLRTRHQAIIWQSAPLRPR